LTTTMMHKLTTTSVVGAVVLVARFTPTLVTTVCVDTDHMTAATAVLIGRTLVDVSSTVRPFPACLAGAGAVDVVAGGSVSGACALLGAVGAVRVSWAH
jgi:hypothetical protein